MIRIAVLITLYVSTTEAFVVLKPSQHHGCTLHSKKPADEGNQALFPVGSFVEFDEKSRTHVGKITGHEHKAKGGARYGVVDSEGKQYDIPDKSISFLMHAPNSPGAASKLYDEFCKAQDLSEKDILNKLDLTPELLEIAWEESVESEESLTPVGFIELVHSHAASAMEKYLAWKLLKEEMSHIYFKEIKDHGRVVSFKAKARKAVDAAKQAFCNSHSDSDLCLV